MTKQEIKEKIEIAREAHYWLQHDVEGYRIKQFISRILISYPTTKTIDLHCSVETKLFLLNMFWTEDFNYLGTRVMLIDEPEGEMHLGELLAIVDDQPLGYFEIMDANGVGKSLDRTFNDKIKTQNESTSV